MRVQIVTYDHETEKLVKIQNNIRQFLTRYFNYG